MFKADVLKKIIEEGGVPFKKGSRSYIFNCPLCQKKKLYINVNEGYFKCFKDDWFKGRCEWALSEIYGQPIQFFKEQLYSEGFDHFDKFVRLDLKEYFDYEESKDWVVEELPEVEFSPNFVDISNTSGMDYLVDKRGLRFSQLIKYSIKYSPSEEAVVFPVIMNNSLKGWQTRSIYKNFKITSKGLDKAKSLMFYDNLTKSSHCVLAEGPISALHAELCGGNVASMGKDVTDYQLELIKHTVSKLYLALDPDASKNIESICRKLFGGDLEVYLLMPPSQYGDLGDTPQELVYEQFLKAPKAFGKQFFYFKDSTELVF